MCQSRVAPYLHRRVHETYNSRGGNFSKSEYIHHLFEETGGLRKNLVQTRIWSSEIAGSRSGNIFPYTFKQRIQLFFRWDENHPKAQKKGFLNKKGKLMQKASSQMCNLLNVLWLIKKYTIHSANHQLKSFCYKIKGSLPANRNFFFKKSSYNYEGGKWGILTK